MQVLVLSQKSEVWRRHPRSQVAVVSGGARITCQRVAESDLKLKSDPEARLSNIVLPCLMTYKA